jgi:branched-subunit amino acid aminotransferase/4-amino-4-deoxychorismate lyase
MDIDIGDTAQIGGAILHTHDLCSPLEDVRIRVTVTAGGRQIIDLKSLNTAKIRGPISVGRLSWDPPSFLPGVIKHGSRAAWVVASTRQGVEEVLLVDSQGNILEASRSNVFVVKDGVVLTPASDERSLEGVTRGALIEAGRRSGLVVEEADVPIDGDYDEFYLSSTLKELAPVVEICGVARESGGPVGDRLLEAFLELVKEETGYESA